MGAAPPPYLKTIEGVTVSEAYLDELKDLERGISSGRVLKEHPKWNKVRWMASGNGQLFVIQDEVLHKLDINRLTSQDQMAGQKNVQWMGVIAGRLCVVKDAKHHWIDWKK